MSTSSSFVISFTINHAELSHVRASPMPAAYSCINALASLLRLSISARGLTAAPIATVYISQLWVGSRNPVLRFLSVRRF